MTEPLIRAAVLVPLGACVGLIGSLIGVGGGFFVVPFLVLMGAAFFPEGFTAQQATAASLGIVLLSVLSATSANVRRRRIDYRTGLVMALGTLPGAWLGRALDLPDRLFAFLFSGFLFLTAVYIGFVRLKRGKGLARGAPRKIVDSDGQTHRYEANLALGILASMVVGLVASLFGVGGGLLLVPFGVVVFGMPTIVATATAQFIFVFTAAAGLLESVRRDQVTDAGFQVILLMGVGVIVGAQLGVAAAKHVRERLVRGMIAAVLLSVAVLMAINTLWRP